jgi:protein phosphatase
LTALRYPERELVSVPAARVYYEPARPLGLPAPTVGLTAQQAHDDLLDIEDVLGKRIISTRLHGNVTIREENAGAALEVMSRFAVNPKWLIYLPPTMAPPDATAEPGFLEYPTEAFAYFRSQGIRELICEEKHMGSRAVIVVCRDEETARHRFGVEGEGLGCCYTRTGRRFFDGAPAVEAAFLARVVDAMGAAGMWEELNTDWLCLDCELMPWSLKASELLRQQYAPAGSAAAAGVSAAIDMLEQTNERTGDLADVLERFRVRRSQAARHVEAYGHYCWEVDGLEGVKLAPFHLLASDGAVHSDRDHGWHMQMLARLAAADPLFVATPSRTVDLEDIDSEADAVSWWRELTSAGGEGIVVKPLSFIARGKRGLVQPAVKCRGAEYLRIIYGPEYDSPRNLERLRSRQVGGKRSLALREFALGIEALERFARAEPLRRVHECVFGVLALESEPIDPRL